MFIVKEDKVVCFDTVLEVFILKGLECTRIVQNDSILWAVISKGFVAKAATDEQRREGMNREWKELAGRPIWSVPTGSRRGRDLRSEPTRQRRSGAVEFKDYGITIVNTCQE